MGGQTCRLLLSFLMVFSISNGLLGNPQGQVVAASLPETSLSSLMPTPTPTPVNLVGNPGFESGNTGWDLWDDASVVSNNANSGTNSVVVSAGDTGFAQDITTGVVENDTYYFEVYGKVDGGQDGRIFVTCLDSNNAESPDNFNAQFHNCIDRLSAAI